jgi:hypothetical protein
LNRGDLWEATLRIREDEDSDYLWAAPRIHDDSKKVGVGSGRFGYDSKILWATYMERTRDEGSRVLFPSHIPRSRKLTTLSSPCTNAHHPAISTRLPPVLVVFPIALLRRGPHPVEIVQLAHTA